MHMWKLEGPLDDVPIDEVPSMAWLYMDRYDLTAALAQAHTQVAGLDDRQLSCQR